MTNDIATRIKEILIKEWDPVGIEEVLAARDEYDSYVAVFARMVVSRRSVSELAAQLLAVETDKMGLPGDRRRATIVARALFALE